MTARRFRATAALLATGLAVLAALALPGLGGCAGGPARESPAGTRVVGGLSLEFPEGFLGQPARTIRSPILLHVRNLDTGKRFLRVVGEGGFAFPAAAGEELALERYEYSQSDSTFSCYLNDEIGIRFRPEPGQVLDLGRITIRYTTPALSNRVTFARSTISDDLPEQANRPFRRFLRYSYWRYARTVLR
ncbi:MAG: hypothetical protein A2064_09490 [Spirochaetes bacterium GWB1_66_5]|nr:MAG: hypothetical protein A2064_09490 [Spirochaetes bacterium GWB1_66_5]